MRVFRPCASAIWRSFDDRRRETAPSAPMLMDMVDAAALEQSSLCSQLVRHPRCTAHTTAFVATMTCKPGAARFSGNEPTNRTLPESVNASSVSAALSNDAAPATKRKVRLCSGLALEAFDSCRTLKMMGLTTVEVSVVLRV